MAPKRLRATDGRPESQSWLQVEGWSRDGWWSRGATFCPWRARSLCSGAMVSKSVLRPVARPRQFSSPFRLSASFSRQTMELTRSMERAFEARQKAGCNGGRSRPLGSSPWCIFAAILPSVRLLVWLRSMCGDEGGGGRGVGGWWSDLQGHPGSAIKMCTCACIKTPRLRPTGRPLAPPDGSSANHGPLSHGICSLPVSRNLRPPSNLVCSMLQLIRRLLAWPSKCWKSPDVRRNGCVDCVIAG